MEGKREGVFKASLVAHCPSKENILSPFPSQACGARAQGIMESEGFWRTGQQMGQINSK